MAWQLMKKWCLYIVFSIAKEHALIFAPQTGFYLQSLPGLLTITSFTERITNTGLAQQSADSQEEALKEESEEYCNKNQTERLAAVEDASEDTGDCGSSVKPIFEVKCEVQMQSSVLSIIFPSFSEQIRENGMRSTSTRTCSDLEKL